jgi:acyl carrier protein phosphodiesterase
MNYLAHAYLSFNMPAILAGNMGSDFIKGKKQYDYPPPVQKGIKLHRAIDAFTDSHDATRMLRSFFVPQYRLYSGAFADVVYDHFLANDLSIFAGEEELKKFTGNCYTLLQANFDFLPPGFQQMLPYMQSQDWLFNYRYREGIQKSFGGLVRRAKYLTESDIAYALFNRHYEAMQHCYNIFFPELKNFTGHQLQLLLKH